MAADQPGVIAMLVAEYRVFIGQNNHTWVVIHKTAGGGSAQDIARFFATDPAMASTHYIVGQDGAIVQCVLEKDGAGGNCCEKGNFAPFLPVGQNLNTWTISIEHVDPASDNSTPLTDAQKAASFRLVRDICQRHNIPMRRGDATGGIIGHSDIDPVDRARCPGNYPWDSLWAYLQEGTDMISLDDPFVTAHFTQTGSNPDRLHCPATGFDLFAGILMGWRQMNGAPRLPKSGEVKCGNTAVYVICEGGILVYDPAHEIDGPRGPWEPCYLLQLGSPLAQKILAIAPPPAQIPASVIDDLRAVRTTNAANDAAIAKVLMDLGVPI